MRINDLLIESSNQLAEGPKFNKFGQAVGNVAGMAAKGVGAVAGGIAGLGAAAKKGFQAGKSQVAAADDQPAATGAPVAGKSKVKPAPVAPTATTTSPAADATSKTPTAPGAAPKGKGFLSGVQAGLSKGISALKDPSLTRGKSKTAATSGEEPDTGATTAPGAAPTQASAAGNQTNYAQVKASIDKLDKKGKQRILQMLQKSVAAPAAGAPAASPASAVPAPAKAAATPAKPNLRKPATVQKPATAPAAEPNYDTQTGVASPAQMKKNREIAKAEAPNGFDPKTGKPNPAPAASAPDELGRVDPTMEPTKPAAGKEKTIANPVATVGLKRATDIGKPTFDTQTGKALPGQAINAIRKKAEYGTGPLGAARKRVKAKTAQPEMAGKINTGSMVLEGFNLFRKK
jgi:hypothetical protein